jgi:hypothetical protein
MSVIVLSSVPSPSGAGLPRQALGSPLILAARLAKSLPNQAAFRMARIRTGQIEPVHLSLAAIAGEA